MAQLGAISMSMDLGGWLHRWLFRDSQKHAEVAEQVRREAQQLRSTAVAVREQLNRYADASDPFVAMLADIYERRQESTIYKGALREWRGPPT